MYVRGKQRAAHQSFRSQEIHVKGTLRMFRINHPLVVVAYQRLTTYTDTEKPGFFRLMSSSIRSHIVIEFIFQVKRHQDLIIEQVRKKHVEDITHRLPS